MELSVASTPLPHATCEIRPQWPPAWEMTSTAQRRRRRARQQSGVEYVRPESVGRLGACVGPDLPALEF